MRLYSTFIKTVTIALLGITNSSFALSASSTEPSCTNYMIYYSGLTKCFDSNLNPIPLPTVGDSKFNKVSGRSAFNSANTSSSSSVCETLSDFLSKSQCELAEMYVGKKALYNAAYNSVSENVDHNEVCQYVVRSKMKAPSTTKFVDRGSSNEIFPGVYFISGDVDS